MLYVTFKQPENFNRDVDVYFNNRYENEWLEDPVVKQIVRDIDHSEILSNRAVESAVLGIIPITRISGGAKALILMLKQTGLSGAPHVGIIAQSGLIKSAV